ncbi:hypothetical protein EAO79_05580 [Plantibacter sp. PA-3-X8]|uniref:hypothetical protein n=1 Tax=Plantibacter sp. PA-3-X8 TaxID=2480625 RepID=UPI000F5F1859|nr:hypothetical protein [Plantibacter sp. PA-3-X8]AZH82428.1 hypothetical protein EAO79_05580 [Plantibacter sp. PA-3-X8]
MTKNPQATRHQGDARILAVLASATFLLDAAIVFGVGFLPGVSVLPQSATTTVAAALTAALFAVQLAIVIAFARLRRASIA